MMMMVMTIPMTEAAQSPPTHGAFETKHILAKRRS